MEPVIGLHRFWGYLIFANIPCAKQKTHDLLQLGTSDGYLKKFDVVRVTKTTLPPGNTPDYYCY